MLLNRQLPQMIESPALIVVRTFMSVSVLLNRQLPQTMISPALIVVRTFMSSLPAAEPSVAPDDDLARLDRRANLHGIHLLGAGHG